VNWTPEERARAQRTAHEQLHREISAFLRDWTYDQPFQPADLADAISNPKIDVPAAVQILKQLREEGRVYYASGEWNPGPAPPEPDVDQV
jgi:hypothetical protein